MYDYYYVHSVLRVATRVSKIDTREGDWVGGRAINRDGCRAAPPPLLPTSPPPLSPPLPSLPTSTSSSSYSFHFFFLISFFFFFPSISHPIVLPSLPFQADPLLPRRSSTLLPFPASVPRRRAGPAPGGRSQGHFRSVLVRPNLYYSYYFSSFMYIVVREKLTELEPTFANLLLKRILLCIFV